MVALLLTAMVVAAVFPVTISTRMNLGRISRRKQAVLYAQNLMDELKAYVTQDITLIPNQGRLRGPGAVPEWQDTCQAPCSSPCYAMEILPCVHDLSSMLPTDLRGSPYQMKLKYRVNALNEGEHNFSSVTVHVDWNEPQS